MGMVVWYIQKHLGIFIFGYFILVGGTRVYSWENKCRGRRAGVVFRRRLLAGSLGKKVSYQNPDSLGHCVSK